MSAYLPFVVWLAAIAICVWIARRRSVSLDLKWRLIVIILGPLAIPLVFLAKPDETRAD